MTKKAILAKLDREAVKRDGYYDKDKHLIYIGEIDKQFFDKSLKKKKKTGKYSIKTLANDQLKIKRTDNPNNVNETIDDKLVIITYAAQRFNEAKKAVWEQVTGKSSQMIDNKNNSENYRSSITEQIDKSKIKSIGYRPNKYGNLELVVNYIEED